MDAQTIDFQHLEHAMGYDEFSNQKQSTRATSRNTFAVPLIPLISLAFLSAATVRAADLRDPSAVLAPFLDDETIAVAHFDTTRIDLNHVEATVVAFPELANLDKQFLAGLKQIAADWIQRFRKAGGRDIYAVHSLIDDLQSGAFGVVPLYEGADGREISVLFESHGIDATAERNDAIVFGTRSHMKRLIERRPTMRTVPKAAFEVIAGADVQFVFIPSNDHRRVLGEFLTNAALEKALTTSLPPESELPGVPRDAIGLTSLAMNDGLQWVSLGVKTSAPHAIHLTIQSKDERSARALAAWLKAAIPTFRTEIANTKDPRQARLEIVNAIIDAATQIAPPKIEGDRLVVRLDESNPDGKRQGVSLEAAVARLFEHAHSRTIITQLKRLALGMHKYHDRFSHFPPHAGFDASGKPLLSWRVLILPYLDQSELYHRFHLYEPWDSEHNKTLIPLMPEIFAGPSVGLRAQNKTTYVVPVGEETIFNSKEGMHLRNIKDGTRNTIMILDAGEDRAVVWTKPDDLEVDGIDLKQTLFAKSRKKFGCVKADGGAMFFDDGMTEEEIRSALTPNSKDGAKAK